MKLYLLQFVTTSYDGKYVTTIGIFSTKEKAFEARDHYWSLRFTAPPEYWPDGSCYCVSEDGDEQNSIFIHECELDKIL